MARFIEYRIRQDMLQQQLACQSGVARFTIIYIENFFKTVEKNRRICRLSTMEKLAQALGIGNINQVDEFVAMKELKLKRKFKRQGENYAARTYSKN